MATSGSWSGPRTTPEPPVPPIGNQELTHHAVADLGHVERIGLQGVREKHPDLVRSRFGREQRAQRQQRQAFVLPGLANLHGEDAERM